MHVHWWGIKAPLILKYWNNWIERLQAISGKIELPVEGKKVVKHEAVRIKWCWLLEVKENSVLWFCSGWNFTGRFCFVSFFFDTEAPLTGSALVPVEGGEVLFAEGNVRMDVHSGARAVHPSPKSKCLVELQHEQGSRDGCCTSAFSSLKLCPGVRQPCSGLDGCRGWGSTALPGAQNGLAKTSLAFD